MARWKVSTIGVTGLNRQGMNSQWYTLWLLAATLSRTRRYW